MSAGLQTNNHNALQFVCNSVDIPKTITHKRMQFNLFPSSDIQNTKLSYNIYFSAALKQKFPEMIKSKSPRQTRSCHST